MRRKELIMSETKKFNFVKYVYGKLFLIQYFESDGCGCFIDKTPKVYSWMGVIHWLKKEGYIIDFAMKNVSKERTAFAYQFNRQKTMYEWYLNAIERSLKKNSISFVPMSELIEKKDMDDFEAQFKVPVEQVEIADRCLAELNRKITEELENKAKEECKKKAA